MRAERRQRKKEYECRDKVADTERRGYARAQDEGRALAEKIKAEFGQNSKRE